MKEGHRPKDIFSNTITDLDCFGLDGFLDSDVNLLLGWAYAIVDFSNKINSHVS